MSKFLTFLLLFVLFAVGMTYLRKHLGITRGWAEFYCQQGLKYAADKDYNNAIEKFSSAINNDSTYAFAYYRRGIAYSEKGDFNAAIMDFDEVIRLRPEDPQAYWYRGSIHKQINNEAQAAKDFATSEMLRLKQQREKGKVATLDDERPH